MASNKHHELAKLAMEQVSDLLIDYPIRQANSFVNTSGTFPRLIKFDYVGKYSLKGPTRLYVEAGIEIDADYKYFKTGYTWKNTKRKYYITNFRRERADLVPNTDWPYVLDLVREGEVGVELMKHELVHYFLPYLDRLSSLDGLVNVMHQYEYEISTQDDRHKHSYFYDWMAVIYLLLCKERTNEAERYIQKNVTLCHLLDESAPYSYYAQGIFNFLDKFQKDFVLSRSYSYDEQLRRIIIT